MTKGLCFLVILLYACSSAGVKEPEKYPKDSLQLSAIKLQIAEIKKSRKESSERDPSVKQYLWDTLIDCNYDGFKDLIFESSFDYPKPGFAFQNSLFDIYYYNITTTKFEAGEKDLVNAAFDLKDSSIFEMATDGKYHRVLLKKFKNKKWQNTIEASSDYIGTDSTGNFKQKFTRINYLSKDTLTMIVENIDPFMGNWPKSIFPYKVPATLHWCQK